MSKQEKHNGHVDWSEQWGEYIIIRDGVGTRHYFDCKAEAQEYLRITNELGHDGYVWRRMGKWCESHKHNYECQPYWQRGNHENNN
jgi:aminoglycoside phosphotransferase (APT) family kinase protein